MKTLIYNFMWHLLKSPDTARFVFLEMGSGVKSMVIAVRFI